MKLTDRILLAGLGFLFTLPLVLLLVFVTSH